MKLAKSVRIGAWILIALNLIMAFGSIWVFMRMAPAIEIIIDQNEKSLQACEEMLSTLAMANSSEIEVKQLRSAFSKACERAKNNITEKEEPDAIQAISKNYVQAFEGNSEAKKKIIHAINHLSEINRNAMVKADFKARQFGNAGAWGIVFMASVVFWVGILFMRGMKKSLIQPLEELHAVVLAIRNGDTIRRCTGADVPQDIKTIFNGINDVLDKNRSNSNKKSGTNNINL